MFVPAINIVSGAGAPAGYDIILATGDSNKFTGSAFSGGTDVADADVVQLGYTSPNTDAVIAGLEPLDYAPEGVTAAVIGHDVHFAIDYYKANGLLLSPRKVLIVGCAKGGSSVGADNFANWACVGGTPGTPTSTGSNLLEAIVEPRLTTALALSGTNSVVAVLDMEGSNLYTPFGNTLALTTMHQFRWSLSRKIQYIRNLVGPTVPIVISRSTTDNIDAAHGTYSYNGLIADGIIRGMAYVFPYLGVANSQSPSSLGTSGIHFSAADQRSLAGRYYTAYLAAIANTARTIVWNPVDYVQTALSSPAGFTLSNGNLDLSGDANSGWKTALTTFPLRSGKGYCEVKVQALADLYLGYLGFCNADLWLPQQLGAASANGPAVMSAGQWGIGDNQVAGYSKDWAGTTSWTTNDIIQFAVDMTSGKAWIGKNNTWYNSGDPAAGTGQWISGIVDPIFIGASIYTGTGNTWRLQPTLASQTYSPPSGFSAWGT